MDPKKERYCISNNTVAGSGVPWFRVHLVVLNDPGRLLSSHIQHTSVVSGWSGVMLLYECAVVETSDPVYNPFWRQGSYVIPFVTRLGVSPNGCTLSLLTTDAPGQLWTCGLISASHLLLSASSVLSASWHWSYWDLELFRNSNQQSWGIDLTRVLGIHLQLDTSLCNGYGNFHLSGYFGPGMWTSDAFSLVGSVRFVKPTFSLIGLGPFSYGVITSHHLVSGLFGISIALWHISARASKWLYETYVQTYLEGVLSSSIPAVFYAAGIVSGCMWYGSATTVDELFGPTRYHCDNAYFSLGLERRLKSVQLNGSINAAWKQIPDKLVVYDYIGCNPAKGGLFRSGAMIKGDGILENWLGHATFTMGTLSLAVRRMPAFFETFPLVLIDQTGTVRADIAFRRGSSTYSIEQTRVVLYFSGGILNGTQYSAPSLVKGYARKAQFGEIFLFDRKTSAFTDGVLRTSPRGWYSSSHCVLALLFWWSNLWHAGRALNRDIWTGVTIESQESIEYGINEKLGDDTTSVSRNNMI